MSTETPDFEARTLVVPRRRRWVRWTGGIAILLSLVAAVAIHGYLNGSAFRAALLGKAREVLKDRVPNLEIGDGLSVDWFARVTLGPVTLRSRDGSLLFRTDRIRIRPVYRAMLVGRVEPASVTFQHVDIDVSAGTQPWVQLFQDLSKAPRPKGRSGGPELADRAIWLKWEDLRLLLGEGDDGRDRAIGPFDGNFQLKRTDAQRVITTTLSLPGHGQVTLDVELGEKGEAVAELVAEAPHLDAILEPIGTPLSVTRGSGTLHASIRTEARGHQGSAILTGAVSDLVVVSERLSADPVGPVAVGGHATFKWDQDERRITVDEGEISIGEHRSLPLKFDGEFVGQADPRFRFGVRADNVGFEEAIEALPAQFSPGDRVPRLEGPFSADLHVKGPLRRPSEWELQAKVDVANLHAASSNGPVFLSGPFLYRASGQGSEPRDIVVGPRNPNFVPVAELPPYLVKAVLTSEDAGFFGHHGFDFQEILDSVVSALEERRVRGASTLTQQLAKNLFLSREKTYGRKVREAVITLALESALSKSRLLEIYLNIIEWGPNVYGIGEAAQHYFGEDARQLTLKQAVFLATIIPNPIKYHFYFDRGGLTETWDKRVRDLLVKLRDDGTVTETQKADAEAAPLGFRSRN